MFAASVGRRSRGRSAVMPKGVMLGMVESTGSTVTVRLWLAALLLARWARSQRKASLMITARRWFISTFQRAGWSALTDDHDSGGHCPPCSTAALNASLAAL